MLKPAALALAILLLSGAAPRVEPPDRALERIMLQLHNGAREEAGVPPVTWDSRLAVDARNWADHLARIGRLEHAKWPRGTDPAGEGENLAGGPGDFSPEQLAGLWLDEGRYFVNRPMPDISRTGHWQDAGHYAQMVWRDTTRIGCAMAGGGFLVCRYAPPGNVWGMKPY